MSRTPLARIAVVAAVLAATTVGCTSTGASDGAGYSSKGSRGGGWENFRAEAPVLKPVSGPVA
jgi:hypothetical protein